MSGPQLGSGPARNWARLSVESQAHSAYSSDLLGVGLTQDWACSNLGRSRPGELLGSHLGSGGPAVAVAGVASGGDGLTVLGCVADG
ncbi:hypothetical protein V6N12_065656 [Hibiscus sabdariffa]|uniref:Uncharacterized protein n=1 Tax=Hibiscus sabdariffa TaxID=183260 RepID=A0ABR2G9C2_9ROSI